MRLAQRAEGRAARMSLVRFDIRPDQDGWTIYDRETDRPASVEGHIAVGLPREVADEIADLLNTLAFIEQRRMVH
jgi:hypothetical protein